MAFDIMDPSTSIQDIWEKRPDLRDEYEAELKAEKDKLVEENKTLKEKLDKAEKAQAVADYQKLLKEKLAASKLPKEAQEDLYKLYEDTNLKEESIGKMIKHQESFATKCGASLGKAKVDVPNTDPEPNEEKDWAKGLAEGFASKAGLKIKEKEGEK